MTIPTLHTKLDAVSDDEDKLNHMFDRLLAEQMRYTAMFMLDHTELDQDLKPNTRYLSDDGFDYLQGCMDATYALSYLVYEGSSAYKIHWLLGTDTDGIIPSIRDIACDGLCPHLGEIQSYLYSLDDVIDFS